MSTWVLLAQALIGTVIAQALDSSSVSPKNPPGRRFNLNDDQHRWPSSEQSTERSNIAGPVISDDSQQSCPPRAFDVFLCHCGGGSADVKLLLDYVRRELQALPSIGGSASIRAFRDEDDLDSIGLVQDALQAAIRQASIGVVALDEHFLRAQWPMWELGVIMAALPDRVQPQPDKAKQAARFVLPVILMDFEAVTATYEQHWTPAILQAAHSQGLPPATLADLERLLGYQGIRIDQHNPKSPTQLADVIVERVLQKLKDLGRVPRGFVRSPARRPAMWTLSQTTNSLVGREGEVEVVVASLRQHGSAVVWGGPGEGKTTIAMEAATRLRGHEPDLSAFELDMRGMQYTQEAASIDPSERARDGLRSCQHHAAALLAPAYMRWQGGSFEAGETDWSQIAAWLRALGDSVLLCFENAEEPLRTSSVAQGFRDFLHELRRHSVRVLVTSRCQLGGGLQGAEQLHLSSLSPQHATELLRHEAGTGRVTISQAQALAVICGSNALALTIIGGLIASHAVTAEEALADAQLAGLRGVDFGTTVAINDPSTLPGSAAAELEARRVSGFWFSQYLRIDQQKATACLSLFAATFDGDGAAFVLHGPGYRPEQRASAVRMLRGLRGVSVVQEVQQPAVPGQLRYSMHPLVRALAVQLRGEQSEDDQDAAVLAFVAYMLWKGGHELGGLSQTAVTAPVAAQLLSWEVPNYAAMLQMIAAPGRFRAAARIDEGSDLGAMLRDTLDVMGIALSRWGQLQLAAAAGSVSFEARRRWPNERDTMCSMHNLSGRLSQAGKLAAAVDMAQQALSAMTRVLGPEHPDTLGSMANLSERLADVGDDKTATDMARQTLAVRQRVLGSQHADTLRSMVSVGTLLARSGQVQTAEKMVRQALVAQQGVLGLEHPMTLSSMATLSDQLAELGQNEAAAATAQQALIGRQRVLGLEHPKTLRSMIILSDRLGVINQSIAAFNMAEHALTAQQRVLGLDHTDTLRGMVTVSERLAALGHYKAAANMARQGLAGYERVLGPGHPNTVNSMVLVSTRLAQLGQHEAAADMARQALAASQRLFGIESPRMVDSLTNLVLRLVDLGQLEEALEMARQALLAERRIPAP